MNANNVRQATTQSRQTQDDMAEESKAAKTHGTYAKYRVQDAQNQAATRTAGNNKQRRSLTSEARGQHLRADTSLGEVIQHRKEQTHPIQRTLTTTPGTTAVEGRLPDNKACLKVAAIIWQ
jgi:hypothetical protein